MAEFVWILTDEAGNELDRTHTFESQADAETWLSAEWPRLGARGAASVTLVENGATIYEMDLGEA